MKRRDFLDVVFRPPPNCAPTRTITIKRRHTNSVDFSQFSPRAVRSLVSYRRIRFYVLFSYYVWSKIHTTIAPSSWLDRTRTSNIYFFNLFKHAVVFNYECYQPITINGARTRP